MPSSLTSTATRSPPAFVTAAATSGALEASIGRTGRPTSSPNAASASLATGQRGHRGRGGRARQHRGAAHRDQRDLGDLGDRLLDQRVEGALAQRRR